jgi:hypothetical protein
MRKNSPNKAFAVEVGAGEALRRELTRCRVDLFFRRRFERHRGDENVEAEVEFKAVDQERIVHVTLDKNLAAREREK